MKSIDVSTLQIIDAAPLDMMRGYAVKRELRYLGFWFVFLWRGGASLRRMTNAGYLLRTMHQFQRQGRAGFEEARYQLLPAGKDAMIDRMRGVSDARD